MHIITFAILMAERFLISICIQYSICGKTRGGGVSNVFLTYFDHFPGGQYKRDGVERRSTSPRQIEHCTYLRWCLVENVPNSGLPQQRCDVSGVPRLNGNQTA